MRAAHWSDHQTASKSHLEPFTRLIALVAMAVLVAACVSRPAENAEIRNVTPMEAVMLHDDDSQTINGDENKDTFDILALSSGGAYGAFGAGVLNGFSERGDRPQQFDVVTGVSTGALMSVLAFLGPQNDALLERLYTDVDQSDILKNRGIEGFFSDSLYDNTPLKKQIEQVVTPRVLKAIAEEHEKGRRLYVATVNLDAGQLVVWDMGEIANGGRTNDLLHFQKVLRASAAVPGFFPPVYIKPQRGVQLRQAHVDGGVKAPILVPDFVFKSPKKKRIWVVVNDSLAADDPVEPIEANLPSIARKSIATLTRQLMIQSVYRGYARSQNSGTEFRVISVPDSLGQGNTSLEFNRAQMRKLFDAGKAMAVKDEWRRRPPNVRKYDVAATR